MINKVYLPKEIEEKYNFLWESGSYINSIKKNNHKGKFYCLDMFPYPSNSGMHVGHWRGYVISDVCARQKWLQGYEILHPMGWDAFGLPAENYAIKNKVHPALIVKESIDNFKKQIKKIGALYDWSKEINTTDPLYYKWTQWIFLKMYKAGLAYEAYTDMNWCPSCKTGLANEEVIKNQCDRCQSTVEKKKIRQWMLKITKYAEQLLDGLDTLQWPEKVKTMQRNWIGKSIGLEISFEVENNEKTKLSIYTTCPETIYGVTFIAISADHPLLEKLINTNDSEELYKKINDLKISKNNDPATNKGVFLNQYAVHPITNQLLPIYVASYVLYEYGTGMIMGVPAHDERDYQFSLIYNIPIKIVIQDPFSDNNSFYEGDGILFNSNYFDGMNAKTKGRNAIIEFLVQKKIGIKKVYYKMRDWIFSRQRYWGEPIPLIHCPQCGIVPVPESQLPIILPHIEEYEPSGNGESPLAKIDEWVNILCFHCQQPAKRETNTMPQWAGSCWYFLRYPDPTYEKGLCSPESMKWLPVDLYVGGIEHAILHLLYARFYIKFLHNEKIIPFDEPFLHLFNQGMVNKKSERTGLIEKMSKSKGNVVNPDHITDLYGTDALRLYVVFMAPPELDCQWQDEDLLGCVRFLKRFWHCFTCAEYETETLEKNSEKVVNLFLKNFSDRITTMHLNTAVSAMMELINSITEQKLRLTKKMKKMIIINTSILIPYTCAELLDTQYGEKLESLEWAEYDPAVLVESMMNIIVQVNGKTRNFLTISKDTLRETIEIQAKEMVSKWIPIEIEIKNIKIIYVPRKLINFVY